MKEVHTDVKRLGTYIEISRRLLRSRVYIRSFILNRIPLWVRMMEDFQIMFGDGQGDNLKGITRYDGVQCVSKYITDIIVSGVAGSIASIESYALGNETMITFSKPQDKIEFGQRITFNNAGTDLDGTFTVKKMNDNKIVVDVPFASATAGDITFEVRNNLFNTVDVPNMGDFADAVLAVMTYAEYNPNLFALNPSDVFRAKTSKDTTGRSLGLVQGTRGNRTISDTPTLEFKNIPPGYYFAGDMRNGVSIIDYTALNIEFSEDTESKLKNFVTLIAQEEIMMPVYNPYAFAYGKIQDVLDAIERI